MKRYSLLLLIFLLPQPSWAAESDAFPKQDTRAIRELQDQAYGAPKLPNGASNGEAMLALAELGAGASAGSAGNLQGSDYDALFSLLQRYRDELLKMGLDASELDTELKTLKLRADELEDRLSKLKPKDGLKIGGRLYSVFDDLHLMGSAPLAGLTKTGPVYGPVSKPANGGIRSQLGLVHAELKLEATRGPLSGYIQFDLVTPWGLNQYSNPFGPRRVYVEWRLPVVMQFGDIDTVLTPLTLWRNEDVQPFEPEPFKSRRQRLLDDLALLPDKWRVTGGRLSTDITFFGSQHLDLESVTAIMGYPSGLAAAAIVPAVYIPPQPGATNTLGEHFNTYMEGWRANLPFGGDLLQVSENGLLFWNVTDSNISTPQFRALNAMVNSVRIEFKKGIFSANLEYAMASYAPETLTYSAVVTLTGTALTYDAAVTLPKGHLKVFGRMVTANFYSAGAQGRTQDNSYQFLGPFLTENSQLGADGNVGVDNNIEHSFESRFNDRLIPPGVFVSSASAVPGKPWQNLLPYGFWENIDPYGAATPNRQGYGAEGDWKFFSGLLRPQASYELFSQIDPVSDTAGTNLALFAMNRMRVGLGVDLQPTLNWPLRFNFGYTAADSSNGAKNIAGTAYKLDSTLLDAGAEYDFGQNMGLNVGYRQMLVTGLNEAFDYSMPGGEQWTILGYGLWWKPTETLRFDGVYSQSFQINPQIAHSDLEADQIVVRLTLGF